ncbi:MAG TPA: glucosamine-6-phosphate deaminase, partial [Gemmataceae bacterium]|nr:glucosamine-6-phosphate deaminase [Gemmataceae bacterium]
MSSHYIPHTRTPALVFATSALASRHVALMIESMIRQNNAAGQPTVVGLPTGSTPLGLYRELIRLHRESGLDFSRVITFNLDEYFPMSPDDPQSYRLWMNETLFNHVNIPPQNIHVPDGTVPLNAVEEYCTHYEQLIRRAGGIDLQLLGIGRTGHIGFNEPGSTRHSRTRLATLDPVTRRDAGGDFYGEENVPHQAITMGVGTILEARKIVIMAFGEHKAPIVKRAVEGEMTDAIAASFLQKHPDTTFILDRAAAANLTAIRRPWTVGPAKWTPGLIRQAVIDLSLEAGKALLKLSDDDFREQGLFELLREHGPAEALGRRVFDEMLTTICTHPAGRVTNNGPPKTILVFSPHPDDDVISMGGTLIRLVEQGHKVHVAYMTSGNIAVFDHDAARFVDFVREFHRLFEIDNQQTEHVKKRVEEFLGSKKPGQPDSPDLLKIKAVIRQTEARAGALACGIPPAQLEFLDLRFYRTGTIAKAPIHPQDIGDVVALLERLQPAQIYVAGELSDPHGTHRVCAEAVFQAVREVQSPGRDFEVWLYRGAWEEWEPHEIDRVVPL